MDNQSSQYGFLSVVQHIFGKPSANLFNYIEEYNRIGRVLVDHQIRLRQLDEFSDNPLEDLAIQLVYERLNPPVVTLKKRGRNVKWTGEMLKELLNCTNKINAGRSQPLSDARISELLASSYSLRPRTIREHLKRARDKFSEEVPVS